jgi:hypothetical protein
VVSSTTKRGCLTTVSDGVARNAAPFTSYGRSGFIPRVVSSARSLGATVPYPGRSRRREEEIFEATFGSRFTFRLIVGFRTGGILLSELAAVPARVTRRPPSAGRFRRLPKTSKTAGTLKVTFKKRDHAHACLALGLLLTSFAPLPWTTGALVKTGISTHDLTLAAGPLGTAEYTDAH